MRPVPLAPSLTGKFLAKTIFTPDGRPLLKAGAELTPFAIESLAKRGYQTIHIQDALAGPILSSDTVAEDTRHKAITVVRATLEAAPGGKLDLAPVQQVVGDIVNDLQRNPMLIEDLNTLRNLDEYLYVHSVNTCIMAVIMGMAQGYSRNELTQLGMGMLLHDLGTLDVGDLVKRPGKLTQEEFERVKVHTKTGYQMLKERHDGEAAFVALGHHERMDGSGYPRGLKGAAIHEFGRIGAVADVFDAIQSDRPYKTAVPREEAAKTLITLAKDKLDPDVVRKFLARLALYPAGTIVILTGGLVGVVVQQTADNPERPLVRVLTDSNGNLRKPEEVDLRTRPDLHIRAVLTDYPARIYEQLAALKARVKPAAGL